MYIICKIIYITIIYSKYLFIMKINFLDGGMVFEMNKKNKDFGEFSLENDENFVYSLYQRYIDAGCKFITTCNYCFKPSYTDNWEHLSKKSVELMQNLRKNNIYVLGSLPPFNKSYHNNKIDYHFIKFYEKLIHIFKNKVDYYIIETAQNYTEIKKIYDIVKKIDSNTPLIISIYPNKDHISYIDEYLKLNIFGLFLNCGNCDSLTNFYNSHLRNKNFHNIKFGISCNKINEKEYSEYKDKSNVEDRKKNLQNFYKKYDEIDKIKHFVNNIPHNEIFIGGCCGYGVEEMKELIANLSKH